MEESLKQLDVLTDLDIETTIDQAIGKKLKYDAVDIPQRLRYIETLVKTMTELVKYYETDSTALISVKQQKHIRKGFKLITNLGLLPCLIPGLGVKLERRTEHADKIMPLKLDDITKYQYLKYITEFFIKSYQTSLFKEILVGNHLVDYLAALIQLSFAPLKKPGIYDDFIMSDELHNTLKADKENYIKVYEELVVNTFQPIIIRDLLLLQSMNDPQPPVFASRIISKELSRRLLASGGLLSLIRCFIESYTIDSSSEWKQIETISTIVSTKHGCLCENDYLDNICKQLKDIFNSRNTKIISIASVCLKSLKDKYPKNNSVNQLNDFLLETFNCDHIRTLSSMPGTLIYAEDEIDAKIDCLHSSFLIHKFGMQPEELKNNIYLLFLLIGRINNENTKQKINDLLLKYLEIIKDDELLEFLDKIVFGINEPALPITFEVADEKMLMKASKEPYSPPILENVQHLISLLKVSNNSDLLKTTFFYSLECLIKYKARSENKCKDLLLLEDEAVLFDINDEQYLGILQILEEICLTPTLLTTIKENPEYLIKLIKVLLDRRKINDENYESVTIALTLLNMLIDNENKTMIRNDFTLVDLVKNISHTECSQNKFLAEEIINMLDGNNKTKYRQRSKYENALEDLSNSLLPVRAHGVLALTKLIEEKDLETLSKKHYVFCIFQEYLKDDDSYLYLLAINGLAALGKHFTEDVLEILCREFLDCSTQDIEVMESIEKRAQLRMKIGDVIVKVTFSLGEMAIVHKTLLLNTMLCVCKDDDSLVRASALSNLAEIARILSYKVGTIIYEILLCIWSIIDHDKSPDCRRAAVMVIASLMKGMEKNTLIQFKEILLPIYKSLKSLYNDQKEDDKVRLHAQIALEELNNVVNEFLFPQLSLEKRIFVLDKHENIL